MINSIGNNQKETQIAFDISAYKSKNQDLAGLSEEELVEHFKLHGYKERRPFAYCRTTVDRLSMKYLRGEGLEIGAGNTPTPLFGDATCLYADIAQDSVFGSTGTKKIIFDINNPRPILNKFDFVIASHVLEHVDSLVIGLLTIASLLKQNGIAYIVLPNSENDGDKDWMPKYGRFHHMLEKYWPGAFRGRHEGKFCRWIVKDSTTGWNSILETLPEELKQDLSKGKISPKYRYLYHRHTYSLNGWIEILLFIIKMNNLPLTLMDISSGEERSDCHFVFERIN